MNQALNNVCRERGIWLSSPYPGVCWILENVLGIDPKAVVADGFTMRGATFMALDADGKRVYKDNGIIKYYRDWTPEERAKLEQWREFIPEWFRVYD